MLEEDFLDAAVYTTIQGNRSASDEDSGDEQDGGQPYTLNRRRILAGAELLLFVQTDNERE